MGRVAHWSLRTPGFEFGGAEKWQIYLAKITIGFVVAVPLWFAHLANAGAMLISAIAIFITSKVCWYLNTKTSPDRWSIFDWICDGVLHTAWFAVWLLAGGVWKIPLVMFLAWLATYAHSSE